MATGWPMKVSYANGDVYSASDVNDTNGTVNLLQTSTLSNSGGKNFIINGGFDNWQRSTSATFSTPLIYPAADRWWGFTLGPTCTMSRQTADTAGLQYGMRFGRNSGQTNTGTVYVETVLETNDTFRLAGRTITFSFYAKAGANASLTALTPVIYTGTGTDQGAVALFSGGWTGGAFAYNTAQTVTTTMTRYSITVTLASTVREVTIGFQYTPTGTAGANEWYQIEGVQVEYGSYATTFSRAGGTIQGELAACQRYYFRMNGSGNYDPVGLGYSDSTTVARMYVTTPPMRVLPTSMDYTNLSIVADAIYNSTAASIGAKSPNMVRVDLTGLSGLTAFRSYALILRNVADQYLGFSSEL
jgi:hypothetical protein